MSHYWDLHCRTCNADAGFHWNRGELQVLEIWKHRAAFVEIGKLAGVITDIDNDLPHGVYVEFHLRFVGPEYGGEGEDFPSFAAAHADHDVTARDEYGQFTNHKPEKET